MDEIKHTEEEDFSKNILDAISREDGVVGVTGSPSTTLEISIDIKEESKTLRVLGQMVYVVIEEDGQNVLVIGQVVSVETQNRWHEDPAFKGVIKRHGKLPHLSGTADNRVATISVQACYNLGKARPEGYILGTSPSTGEDVQKMTNPVMKELMKENESDITYIGKVYGTDVDLPFWFKHFDKTDELNKELGAGDAYHIGVFGKTGSGKSVMGSYMLLGYAKNKNNMNILVLDPQGQFYNDRELIPESKLEDKVNEVGMKYKKYKILEDLYLPGDSHEIFTGLLQKSNFIKRAFNILSDREVNAADAICSYLYSLLKESRGASGNLNVLHDKDKSLSLMKSVLKKFTETEEVESRGRTTLKYNKYVDMIYSQPARKDQLIEKLNDVLNSEAVCNEIFERNWQPVVEYFTEKKENNEAKMKVKDMIKMVTDIDNKGNFVVLDLSGNDSELANENIKAMFVKIIENDIKEIGVKYYAQGKKVNCLVVMDEAHRFISHESSDEQIVALTNEIIDAVRTTRKYGIGYMFITQTIESLDREILRQMRICAFGYGLTTGPELRKVGELVNSDSALKLYKSFIDPSSNNKFPFMFYGPISPLSFTGSPLFLEAYTDPSMFK